MAIEIKIGAPHLTIHHGHGVLISEPDGTVTSPSEKGLFFRDTRLISRWRITANGQPWKLLNSVNMDYNVARLVATNPPLTTADGELKQHVLGLTISRILAGGMHEDLDLANYGMDEARFNLEIEMTCDFADFFEVKGRQTIERSGIASTWSENDQSLTTTYRHGDFCRGLKVAVRDSSSPAVFANGKIVFAVELQPGCRWRACLRYDFRDGDDRIPAPDGCFRGGADTDRSRATEKKSGRIAELRSPNIIVDEVSRQAAEDMAALRLHVPGTRGAPIVAAGVPWFLSLFGRDSIIASLQFQIVDPEFSFGVLDRLGELQAREIDDYRDAEPGKIPHELRHGELAFFRKIPHTPYYGTADATPLYLILLHSAWKRTGDDRLLDRHLDTADACLTWIDQHGDRDGDGFQEYQTRSSAGYENQSWKDAGDAILYPDGADVKGPKATCELQGYVFDAWLRMAEVYDALGKSDRAAKLRRKAADLYRHFNEEFWDEEAGFYALALDGDKKRVMSIASNPGHCLWSGIVPPERARRVVDRLMQADMWSGWGIRTLSAKHPAYNPFSYQNGSVWPHDNSMIAIGMKRYGFTAEVGKVSGAICEAASCFMANRLPELFAGTTREEIGFPQRYLGANVPQAWATGAIFALAQAWIGFQPDAPRERLELDPALPSWLDALEICNLRLGERTVDLRFTRQGETTHFEVTRGDGRGIERRPVAVLPGRASLHSLAGR